MTIQPARSAPRASESLVRAVFASLLGEARGYGSAEATLQRLYPGDQASAVVLRAAVSPASLGAAEWAGVLASTAVADFVTGLGPISAAAQLIASSLQVDLGRHSGVLVPSLVPSAGLARFVAEGKPIPVASLVVGGPVLKPSKLAAIIPLTRETLQTTAAEAIVRAMLRESVALSLDAAMFGSAAAVAGERPAGLLNGLTAITATAGGGEEAMIADLEALASAVAAVAGGNIVFVAAPDQALRLSLRRAELPFRVLTSAALTAGTIMAVAPAALVTAIDPVPEIDSTSEALLHSHTDPAHISTAGTPNAISAPAESYFQTDVTALRLILGASWALRASGAVAVVNGATW